MAKQVKKRQLRPRAPLPAVLPLLLDRALVGSAISTSTRNLDRMVATGLFPVPDVRDGHFVRWKRQTVEGWIEAKAAVAAQ